MNPGFVSEMIPLGPRLEAAARALRTARECSPAWLVPLAEVLERVQRAPLMRSDRFARVEATDLHRVDVAAACAAPAGETSDLPDSVRGRLRSQVGPAADRVRVHDDDAAHRLARDHGADAVTVGTDVYFARGRYQPHDSHGFALLAHEVVHVDHATRPDALWQRTGAAALAAEEVSAHAAERVALRNMPADMPHRFAPPPAATFSLPAAALAMTAPTAQRPMRAGADRVVDTATSGSAMDLEAMRQTLMRDLMSQIRADMERGG